MEPLLVSLLQQIRVHCGIAPFYHADFFFLSTIIPFPVSELFHPHLSLILHSLNRTYTAPVHAKLCSRNKFMKQNRVLISSKVGLIVKSIYCTFKSSYCFSLCRFYFTPFLFSCRHDRMPPDVGSQFSKPAGKH